MTGHTGERAAERHLYLWLLAAAPAIWVIYFLASYVTVAVWCAKFAGAGGSMGSVRATITWYTMAALAGIVLVGWSGVRRSGFRSSEAEHTGDTPEDRDRFLGVATSLLAALSALATAMVGLSVSFTHACW